MNFEPDKTKPECEEVKQSTNQAVIENILKDISKNFESHKCPNSECGDILVVDDNEFNRFLLMQLLGKYGFRCKMVQTFTNFNKIGD